jgi:hypothetical protein
MNDYLINKKGNCLGIVGVKHSQVYTQSKSHILFILRIIKLN